MKYDLYKGPQYYRQCDHQSVQSVLIVGNRPTDDPNDMDVFNIIEIDPADEALLASCASLGHGRTANFATAVVLLMTNPEAARRPQCTSDHALRFIA